jgi:CRP-like cAMP-binding protein
MHLDPQNIHEIDLFRDLSSDELDKILPVVHPVKIFEGERLIRAGDTSQTLYIIISGNDLVYYKDAVALTDGEALIIPIEEFLYLMQLDSDLGNKITKRVTETVRQRKAFINETRTEKE